MRPDKDNIATFVEVIRRNSLAAAARSRQAAARQSAAQAHANTRSLTRGLAQLDGVELVYEEFFHEAVLRLDRSVAPVLDALAEQGILGGYDLSADYPELGHALLVCATETRTPADIDHYIQQLGAALANSRAA